VKTQITLTVNGETRDLIVAVHKTLLEVLREDMGLTGTKHGCELGECGTCTVLVDGEPVLSCLALPVEMTGRDIKTVEGMADVVFEGKRVSSSAVRAALQAGDLRGAERLLGHPYAISGRVAHGAKLGRSLGFPTANIVLRRAPPISGIFVVEVDDLGRGVASVGRRPTVNPVSVPLLEVHLLDHDADLYGEHLRVRFLEKLRDEEKYDGLPALQAAIARDARQAKEYFLRHG